MYNMKLLKYEIFKLQKKHVGVIVHAQKPVFEKKGCVKVKFSSQTVIHERKPVLFDAAI